MIRRRLIVSTVAVLVGVLLACSVVSAMAKTPVTIWLTDSYGQNLPSYFDVLMQKFEQAHMNIDVTVQVIPGGWTGLREKYVTAAASNQGPTIIWSHASNNWELESQGFFAAIPKKVLDETRLMSRFINYSSLYRNDKGEYTRIPWSLQNGLLFYNTSLLANAGVDVASLRSSWDSFRTGARKLTKVDSNGQVTQSGFDQRRDPAYLWIDMVYQQGDYLFTKEGRANFSGMASLKATDLLMDMMQYQPAWTVGPAKNPSFAANATATMYGWGWVSNWLTQANSSLEFGVSRMPTMNGSLTPAYGRMNAEEGIMVSASAPADQQAAAWDIAKFVLNDSNALVDIAIMTGGIPLDRKLWSDKRVGNNPVMATMAETLPYSVFPGETGVITRDYLAKAWDQIANRKMSPFAAFDQAAKALDAKAAEMKLYIIERRYSM